MAKEGQQNKNYNLEDLLRRAIVKYVKKINKNKSISNKLI